MCLDAICCDWLDVQGVLTRRAASLDSALILEELAPLLELRGDHGSLDRLRNLHGWPP